MNVSLQGPLLARVRTVRDVFAFMDDADALRYLIRVGLQHVTPQLFASQTAEGFGSKANEQFALALRDMTRALEPHDPPDKP